MKNIWLFTALLFAVWLLSGWRYSAQAQQVIAPELVLLMVRGSEVVHSQEFKSRGTCENASEKVATWGVRTVCVPK